ncbi:hypothetical protein P4C99_00560 [Pontiellaceae bacterium B1224]|nr:hypothetical protein [Pontiellaceae bacterium B1224]
MKILIILSLVLTSAVCCAEWEIISIQTNPFSRESYNGPPEVEMNIEIRNTSEKPIYIYGQDFGNDNRYYQVESFIKEANSSVWERQNSVMCGSVGKIGWLKIEAGETIHTTRTLYQEYIGREMILAFRRSYSTGDSKGSEVLLGPFKIPEMNKTSQRVDPAVKDQPSKQDDEEMQAYSKSLMELTPGELLKEAMVQLQAEHNEIAIDLMYCYLSELTLRSPREFGVYQGVRFKLASLLMTENRMEEAAQLLEDYIDSPLAERESEAREMLKACTLEIGGKG